MALAALATQADLTRFGYAVPANADALLLRASARIRLAAGHQEITSDTSTVIFPYSGERSLKLWQFPATTVHAVVDDQGATIDDWQLTGNELSLPCRDLRYTSTITVTYDHGFTTLPDELVELVCAVAVRMSGTKADRDPAIQAQTVGDVSQTVNPAALEMTAGLLPGEFATIRRIFYRRG